MAKLVMMGLILIPAVYAMSVAAIGIDAAKRTEHKGLMASSVISLISSIVLIITLLVGFLKQGLLPVNMMKISMIISMLIMFSCNIYAVVVADKFTDQDIAKDAKERLFNNSIAVVVITGFVSTLIAALYE